LGAVRAVARAVWWAFWALIDEASKGSDLD